MQLRYVLFSVSCNIYSLITSIGSHGLGFWRAGSVLSKTCG